MSPPNKNELAPSYCCPGRLVKLAAQIVTRCLIYEDDQCYHYRWDPVNIWQFEIPLKKKKGRKASERNPSLHVNDATAYTPQPQWQEIKKFRDWWSEWSPLGGLDSVLRAHIMAAVEQFSWSAKTEEEDVLFLLLRLCIDTKIELSGIHFDKFSEWCGDLAQVISKLGPFPLQKLFVTHDSLGIQPVLVSIVQQSPNLQVVHMNQWALNNEFMSSLGSCCGRLAEFSIPLMKPQVFMSDEILFSCFFGGQSSEEVVGCWRNGQKPRISFPKLKFVDILFWKQTEKFIQMLSVFCPNVRLRAVDTRMVVGSLVQPFQEVKSQLTALVMVCHLGDIMHNQLENIVRIAPYLKEVRVHIDDSFYFDSNSSEHFKHQLDNVGVKLKSLVCEISAFEALALCPHHEMNMSRLMLPTLQAKGACVTSLLISHEISTPDPNTLYQLINLCPRLCYLAISIPLITREVDDSPDHSISLNPCQALRTLVVREVQDLGVETEVMDGRIRKDYIDTTTTILKAAPDLKVFGISVSLKLGPYFHSLASASVHTLHLHVIPKLSGYEEHEWMEFGDDISPLDSFLFSIVPKFPALHTLSVDQEDNVDLHVMAGLYRSAISITKWRPEFFQELPSWDTISMPQASRNFNIHVM